MTSFPPSPSFNDAEAGEDEWCESNGVTGSFPGHTKRLCGQNVVQTMSWTLGNSRCRFWIYPNYYVTMCYGLGIFDDNLIVLYYYSNFVVGEHG